MHENEDYKTPESRCPRCNHRVDGAMNVSGKGSPEEGDFTVRIRCGAPSRFGKGLKLAAASPEDLLLMATNQPKEFGVMCAAVRAVKRMNMQRAARN